MKVTLLQHTQLNVCSHAIRTCWQSFDKGDNGGPKDMELIGRVANKYKHESVLEHLVYTFYIQGISRACLQELARHRMASLSVKSSRYTLKELRAETEFNTGDKERASKYVVFTGDQEVDSVIIQQLEALRKIVMSKPNDIAKYAMPESYKTELTWTINARSLKNFILLRCTDQALWEIRDLARSIIAALPDEHMAVSENQPKD